MIQPVFRMKTGLAPLILFLLTAAIYIGCAATPGLIDEADCGHAIASRDCCIPAVGLWCTSMVFAGWKSLRAFYNGRRTSS